MVILITKNLVAQTTLRCKHTAFTRQSGMSNQLIREIAEDSNGFLWLVSDNNLQWFDGSLFHTVPFGYGIHQVPGTAFIKVHATKEKEVWIFYEKGFSVYQPATHSFKHYTTLIPPYNNFYASPVAELDNEIVINNGAYFFYVDKKTKQVNTKKEFLVKLKGSGFIYPLHKNMETPFIIFKSKLMDFEGFLKNNTADTAKEGVPTNTFILNKTQWLLFDDTKLGFIENNILQKKIVLYPGNKKLITYRCPAAVIKKNDQALLVLLDDELWEFDIKSMQFTRQLLNLNNKQFITNGYFKNAFYDSRGNLWAASNLYGLIKIVTNSQPIQLIATANEKDNFIKCLYVNKAFNKIITGTYGSGLLVYDTLGHLLKHFPLIDAAYPSANIISSIAKIDNDNYLILVYNCGTQYVLNTRHLSITKLTANIIGLRFQNFFPAYYAELIEAGNATFYYLKTGTEFLKLTVTKNTLLINAIAANDSLYIRQLSSYKSRSTQLRFYSKDDYFTNCLINAGIKGIAVNCLVKWNDDWLIGTAIGIFKFNKIAALIKHYNHQTGLPDETINAFVIDKENNLWCSHNKGLSRINNKGEIFNLHKEDGLQDDEFNYGAATITPDGQLFFGGIKGLSTFFPHQLYNIADTPRIVITGISTSGQSLPTDTAFWQMRNLQLSYNDNWIKIIFAASGNSNAGYYNYQYRIKGFNNEWNNIGNEKEINLALPPGKYTVDIAANNGNRQDITPQQSISIQILPPFYKRWWFIGLCGLGVFFGIGYILYYINKQKYRKIIEALKVKEELELERQRISRDLHDNMGAYTSALIANVEKLKTKTGEDEDVVKMQNNAEQILSSLRETIWVLNNKEVSIADFSDGFKNYCFKLLKNFEHISFDAEEQIEENKMLSAAVAIHLNKILQEAVQNIIKHSNATQIRYSIFCNKQLSITIADNGKGFDGAAIKKGNGLDNIQWRAKEVEVTIEIISLPGKGTSIIIKK